MSIQRLAVIFDNSLRPETTGFYCQRALAEIADVTHFLPTQLSTIDPQQFDAFIYIDDGLDYDPLPNLRPSVWWAIDTHLNFDRCLQKALRCDMIFSAQKDGVEKFHNHGINAEWLPLACDPDLHRLHQVGKKFDWCFVGHLIGNERQSHLNRLQQEFTNGFVGQRFFEEMAVTYSQSRVVFNRSIENDINMRVFEALACGSLLVTNDLAANGLSELFQPGIHLVTYQTEQELIDRVRYFLIHDEERERIAEAGRTEVLAKHTYRHRMEQILHSLAFRSTTPPIPRQVPGKGDQYYEWERPDILAMIPPTARCVADLGCGGGRLGYSIRSKLGAVVWGVERDVLAANRATQRLDHVIVGDLDSDTWSLPDGRMDVVICADVLEHLRQPARLLHKARKMLAPDGCLIASVPNLQHHSVVAGLLDGNFTYEPAGLLDEDHVRLFTRREIDKLFYRSGFRITEWRVVPGSGYAEWASTGRKGEVRIGGLQISGLTPERAEEFFAYQYLVRAEVAPQADFGLTSIILVTYNQFHYTQMCVESLRFRTDEPFELIVVDNGSTDETVDYFRNQPDVTLIANPDNRGFPAAVNQGLAVATGRQILLLNNDTIVSTGWLRRILETLASDPKIGLVGPVSNSVSGPQEIDVSYRDLASMDGFAWDHGRRFAQQRIDLDRLVGFCLLIRREVINTIGTLDERFGIGNFEDDDYCRRAHHAGFRIVVACDSFVHHFGSRTFVGSGIDTGSLLRENRQKFQQKWETAGTDVPKAVRGTTMSLAEAPGGGLLLVPTSPRPSPTAARPRLSLCMIVRNNETTIRPCLQSIRPWVDEMIVVDTGSTDATPQFCAELGAKVFHWPWRDDFAAARNESLSHASGEWVFWMDSDDTIPSECGQRLRTLADGTHEPLTFGFVMQVQCPDASGDPHDMTIVDHVKMFRNLPNLRFEHRIHEQILPAIRRAGGDVTFTDIYVVHSGADRTVEGRQRKLERDFRLLELDLAERPDHPFVLFNLGMTHADVKQYAEAIKRLSRCLEVSNPQESHVRKTYALLISCLMQSGQSERAASECQRAMTLFPDDKEILFRTAMSSHERGELRRAVDLYRKVLVPSGDRHFVSVDAGLTGFKARHNLALVFEELGQTDSAANEWRAIIEEHSGYVPAYVGLIECLLRSGHEQEAVKYIETLRRIPGGTADGFRMSARLMESKSGITAAIAELRSGLECCPHDSGLLRELARMLHSTQDYLAALEVLNRLIAELPEDVSAWHNRGVILGLLHRLEESQAAFQRVESLKASLSRGSLPTPSHP